MSGPSPTDPRDPSEPEVVDEQGRPIRSGASANDWRRESGRGEWGRDIWTWGWSSPEPGRRRGVPWIGVFFVLLGAGLLLEQLQPNIRIAGSAFLLALGLAFLSSWAVDRRPGSLYAGVILTALGLSNVLTDSGVVEGPGWGTLFLGVGFALIATVRASSGGGWGWQLWFGAIIAVVGAARIGAQQIVGFPDLGRVVWPIVLVLLGLWLVIRARGRGAYS